MWDLHDVRVKGTVVVQNKHFKALVRERMAKTGERYTAARHHLLATQPIETNTAGLLSNYPRVPVGYQAPASQYDAALWQRVFSQAGVLNPAQTSRSMRPCWLDWLVASGLWLRPLRTRRSPLLRSCCEHTLNPILTTCLNDPPWL